MRNFLVTTTPHVKQPEVFNPFIILLSIILLIIEEEKKYHSVFSFEKINCINFFCENKTKNQIENDK